MFSINYSSVSFPIDPWLLFLHMNPSTILNCQLNLLILPYNLHLSSPTLIKPFTILSLLLLLLVIDFPPFSSCFTASRSIGLRFCGIPRFPSIAESYLGILRF